MLAPCLFAAYSMLPVLTCNGCSWCPPRFASPIRSPRSVRQPWWLPQDGRGQGLYLLSLEPPPPPHPAWLCRLHTIGLRPPHRIARESHLCLATASLLTTIPPPCFVSPSSSLSPLLGPLPLRILLWSTRHGEETTSTQTAPCLPRTRLSQMDRLE